MNAGTVDGPHALTRRRGLPRGRAVVGGFLVAVAAVTVFAAYRRAEAPPATSYVTVTRDIAAGEVLAAGDLTLAPIELPQAQAASVHTAVDEVDGAVATHPLRAGELVSRSAVRTTDGYVAPVEVAFALPTSTALGGSLVPGERVDVLATYGTGADATTLRVAADVLVMGLRADDELGGGVVNVRLGLATSSDALAVTHAAAVADVVLTRGGAEGAATAVYRPFAGATGPVAEEAARGPVAAGSGDDAGEVVPGER